MTTSKYILFALFCSLIIFCESSFFTVPLLLVTCFLFYIFTASRSVFLFAFIFGSLLDILLIRAVGTSSLFITFFLFVTSLYDKKYETNSLPFVLVAVIAGSIIWALVLGQTVTPMYLGLTLACTLGLFFIFRDIFV